MTTGGLVGSDAVLAADAGAAVFPSNCFFVDGILESGFEADEYGNKSIIIGLEDEPGDGGSLMLLRLAFEFAP